MKTRSIGAGVMLALVPASISIADTNPNTQAYQGYVEDLSQLVESNREDVLAMVRLGVMLRQIGRHGEAERVLAEAAALEPNLNRLLNPGALADGPCTDCGRSVGADVIVGDLNGMGNYTSGGPIGGKLAFSVGTTSCNIGTVPLTWFQNTNAHPVIAQNMYRLMNGRFEQIGQSHLKHGFCALQQGLCGACTPVGGGCEQWLGVGCSDPYSASLNGEQGNLGPRYQVNPWTAAYPYPPAFRTIDSTLSRRLVVDATDLDPALNTGAIYFVEGQYVDDDDAAAGNGMNNASYRRFNPFWNSTLGTVTGVSFGANTTQRQKAAIQAWQDNDGSVTIVNADAPNDGRFIVGYKVTDNGNGTWTYEYAVQNLNSERAGRAFAVQVPTPSTATNIGFHDVDYHSWDGHASVIGSQRNFDGTDWPSSRAGGLLTWETSTFTADPNANALRWGTLYNYRFTSNGAPVARSATISLFKAGTGGDSVSVPVMGPACVLEGDISGDGVVNFNDLNLVLSAYGTTYTFSHLNQVLSQFGLSCN